jgi:ankyrin repeat protein
LIDDDDTMYVVHSSNKVKVVQLSPDGFSEVRSEIVLRASDVGADSIEGNRMYKINGMYYILNDRPGSTTYVWKSASPWGPYEAKILVDSVTPPLQGGNSPHQGSLIQTPAGDWYFMSFTWAFPAGRLPVLAPITWGEDGFPSLVVGENGGWGQTYPMPLPARPLTNWTGTYKFTGAAAVCGHADIVRILLKHDLCHDAGGGEVLRAAVRHGQANVVEAFLQHSTNLSLLLSIPGCNLLWWAISYRRHDPTIPGILINYGYDMEDTLAYGTTALHEAAKDGYKKTARLLLGSSAQVNARSSTGKTPLSEAALWGRLSTVRLLLEHDADSNAKDAAGKTPLSKAASFGRLSTVRLLLEHGADPNAKDAEGRSVLHLAALKENYRVAQLLLKHGANLEEVGPTGLPTLRRVLKWKLIWLLHDRRYRWRRIVNRFS